MRASGFSRWTRRIVCLASSSAAAVTVQVFRMTRSAPARSGDASKPLAASNVSKAAPSACVARHPKFWTKYFPTYIHSLKSVGRASRPAFLNELRIHEKPGVGVERHGLRLCIARNLEALPLGGHLDAFDALRNAHLNRKPVGIARLRLGEVDLDLLRLGIVLPSAFHGEQRSLAFRQVQAP